MATHGSRGAQVVPGPRVANRRARATISGPQLPNLTEVIVLDDDRLYRWGREREITIPDVPTGELIIIDC